MLASLGVGMLLVFEFGHKANLPNWRLSESALAEARALPVLVDYYFTEMVLVAISLPPTNTVTLCEPFGAATT